MITTIISIFVLTFALAALGWFLFAPQGERKFFAVVAFFYGFWGGIVLTAGYIALHFIHKYW